MKSRRASSPLIPLMLSALFPFLSAPCVRAAEVIVTVQDYRFEPKNVVITVGDTVTWKWLDGFHSTTSGTAGDDQNAGLLWDQYLFAGQETLSYTFTAPGSYPFFCRFHEALDMKGSVWVSRYKITSVRGKDSAEGEEELEPASWGAIKGIYR